MIFRMKTTLIIADAVFRELKRRATERATTLSELATELMRQGLRESPKRKPLPRLPSFSCGPPLVDMADRAALYRLLNAERHARLYGANKKG